MRGSTGWMRRGRSIVKFMCRCMAAAASPGRGQGPLPSTLPPPCPYIFGDHPQKIYPGRLRGCALRCLEMSPGIDTLVNGEEVFRALVPRGQGDVPGDEGP